MFDQNDQSQQTQSSAVTPEPVADSIVQDTTQPQMAATDPIAPSAPVAPDPIENTAIDMQSSFNTTVVEPPSTVADTTSPAISTILTPTPDPIQSDVSIDEPTKAPASDELMTIKQEALQNLSPLLSQLDQTPEEKFRTTMMLIQASDNQSLIQSAYGAAKEIEDEKVRAQALLDIVNEINYFTQHKPEPSETPTV